jgi:hypothetical protein
MSPETASVTPTAPIDVIRTARRIFRIVETLNKSFMEPEAAHKASTSSSPEWPLGMPSPMAGASVLLLGSLVARTDGHRFFSQSPPGPYCPTSSSRIAQNKALERRSLHGVLGIACAVFRFLGLLSLTRRKLLVAHSSYRNRDIITADYQLPGTPLNLPLQDLATNIDGESTWQSWESLLVYHSRLLSSSV